MSASKIDIVGIGDDGLEGLTTPAKQLVERAELLVGTRQSLEAVTDSTAEKIEIGGDLDAVVRKVDAAGKKRVVVLAAGDPLFYGVARYLCDKLGKDRFEVLPHVSTMQLAFARNLGPGDRLSFANIVEHNLTIDIANRVKTGRLNLS